MSAISLRAAFRMSDEIGDRPNLRDCFGDVARRRDIDETIAEPFDQIARRKPGERPSDHEIRLDRDDRLAAIGIVPERRRAVGERRQPGVRRVGRQPRDLSGVGEGDEKLVRAQVDRDDAARDCRATGMCGGRN